MTSPLRRAARRVRDAIGGHLGRSQSGITFVIFAMAIVVILGMVAVGIDGARLFDERRRAQNAADHAAVTAAHAFCILPSTKGNLVASIAAGETSAANNGYDDGATNDVAVTNPSGRTFVATVDTTIPATFSQVIGWSNLDTGAVATAECQGGGGPASTGAIYAGGDCSGGKWALDMSGQSAEVIGGVHSNGDVSIASDQDDQFTDNVSPADAFEYVGLLKPGSTTGNFFESGYPDQVSMPAPQWPAGWDPGDVTGTGAAPPTAGSLLRAYYDLADSNGTTNSNDTLFTNQITSITKDGVYYTTSTSGMDISSITGTVRNIVLVAPNGPIKISTSTSGLTMNAITDDQLDDLPNPPPATVNLPRAGILILSNKIHAPSDKCGNYSINISGQNATWNGIMWAPGGVIEFAGSDNLAAKGSLVSWAVKTSGYNISIRWDPDLFDTGDPDIVLLQ